MEEYLDKGIKEDIDQFPMNLRRPVDLQHLGVSIDRGHTRAVDRHLEVVSIDR